MKHLPQRKRIRLPHNTYAQENVFSITITTSARYPWFQLYPDLVKKFIQLCIEKAKKCEASLYAWCIMPDHIHILLQDKNIISFVRAIKGKLTPIARRLEAGRPLWQRSFFDHALRGEESLDSVTRYIWENPVRAGLSHTASAYA